MLNTINNKTEINPTDPPFRDGIYYFKKKGHHITPIRCDLFSDDDLIQIGISVQIMERLFKNLNRSFAVKEAFEEFVEETKKPTGSDPFEAETVDRRFRAFIFEWKLYSEHWKNYIFDLGESVWPDEFVTGYQELYRNTMKESFKDSDYVTAHVIRNYISHANDAINNCHIDGRNNKYCIYRNTLELFLNESIDRFKGKRREEQEEQLKIIQGLEELVDLVHIAENAMSWLQKCESILMNYQIEPQLLKACRVLGNAKETINASGIQSDVWEIWRQQPLYLDHQTVHSFTIGTTIDGQNVKYTFYRNRLNWIGYEATRFFIISFLEQNETFSRD